MQRDHATVAGVPVNTIGQCEDMVLKMQCFFLLAKPGSSAGTKKGRVH